MGVERFFSSAIPEVVKTKLKAQKELLIAIQQGQRNIEDLKSRYRHANRKTNISPSDLVDLMMGLVSGEVFSNYIDLDKPFVLGSIEPQRGLASVVPEKVKVSVSSDLNLDLPAAKGELKFKRNDFKEVITKSVESFTPKKK